MLIDRIFLRVISDSTDPQTAEDTVKEGKSDWPYPWERINPGFYKINMDDDDDDDDDDDELFVKCQGGYKISK